MALSYQTAVSDGTLSQFNLSIEYSDRSEITVYIDGIYIPSTLGRYTWQGDTSPILLFNPPIPAGQVLLARRSTDLRKVRNIYEAGAQFNPATLDENFAQVLRVAQEVLENARGDVSPNDAVRSFNARSGDVILTSNDVKIALGYTPASVGGGGEGLPSSSITRVYAYQRAPVIPTESPGDVVFNFGTGSIQTPTLAGGWMKQIPEGDYPLWVTVATANSTSDTDNIGALEWTTPVVLTKNGLNGLSTATVYLYQRTSSTAAPGGPTGNVTYAFANGVASNASNGWSPSVPSYVYGKPYLWVITATAANSEGVDVILPSEWGPPQIMAKDGQDGTSGSGSDGAPGQRGTVNIAVGGYTSWSNAAANEAISSAGYGAPINRDMVTLYGSGFSQTRYYQSGTWLTMAAYINGNMLVSGTLSASMIAAGVFDGSRILYGTGSTPSGRAFEITSVGTVYADNMFCGILQGSNQGHGSSAAILGNTYSDKAGVHGAVTTLGSSGTGTAAVYGTNYKNGSAGMIAPGLAYDFYATGSGTNYGPFTGAHDALVDVDKTVIPGDLVVDVACIARAGISNTIFEVERSTTLKQAAVLGVAVAYPQPINWVPAAFISGRDADFNPIPSSEYAAAKLKYQIVAVNALGEGQINVTGEGGNIAAGALLVASSTPGKATRQDDNQVRSYTVARAREAVTFSSPTEVKQIACIYLCG